MKRWLRALLDFANDHIEFSTIALAATLVLLDVLCRALIRGLQ